jgi:hypothetical protein
MDQPQDIINLCIGVSILIGAAQCFAGYRIFKFILGLMGFIIGGILAAGIGLSLSQEPIIALLAGLVGGLIGGSLLIALYFVGVFLFGAMIGGMLGVALFAAAGNIPEPTVLIIVAVIMGIVALIFQKWIITISTSFGGAGSVVTGIAYFTSDAPSPLGAYLSAENFDPAHIENILWYYTSQSKVVLLCWLILGIAGVMVQYKTAPPQKNESARPQKNAPSQPGE